MRINHFCIFLFVFCGIINNLSAQKTSIKLPEAIEIALKNNRIITASNLEIDYQKTYKKSLNELPKTSISTTLGQYNSKRFDNQFNLSQGFYLPKVFRANDALGESLIKSSELKGNLSKNALILQVRQVYLSLQYLYEREQLLLRQDSISKDFLRIANLRYKTGESNILEKTNAETQVNEIQNQIKQNQSDILGALANLKTLLSVNEAIEIADKKLNEMTFVLSESAIQNNPNLAFLKQQIAVSEQQKAVEKARLSPDFNIGYINQSLIGVQNIDNQDVYFGGGKRFQAVQLGMNIPIFKKAYQAKINSAEIEKQIAENNQKSFEINLKGHFEQLNQELIKYRTALQYFRNSALPNAELILKTTQTAIQKGELSYTEYLFNLKNANAIKEQYLQTLWQYNQTIQELNYLVGQ
jgi:heavy metal efflux system protein